MNFKKIIYIFLGLLIAVGILVGGHKLQEKREYDQMVEIVESKEVRKLIENDLKGYDPKAFTKDGLIITYKVETSTIEHNPMGGVNFELIINNKKSLSIEYNIDKGIDEKLTIGTKVLSEKLANFIESN
ncbi:DUF1310 family protein [Streptococcus uberis]|uniref:DUF1310 family protein n=2 Tax=Streptococcus uberis TaxID=1349 RepID=UPI0018E0FAAF|nr:DUF1310 family protein [Streptococcus uberis]MBI0907992.1 DUF1310 family protein [Streptococcus uberis]MCK1195301.1 DUF1310 domain-containing protein [Streptococcus uberis]MCK1198778.1 DUF1310 domain-containing protein [Streptococcus uberis]MCK1219451.1 DUF1310 domain-containing protein [Streptococcus uberis]MCK1250644.1 DUF1310 domain-containing protein [Streptococcus uberis]